MFKQIILFIAQLSLSSFSLAHSDVDFEKVFKDQDGCFVIRNLRTGKTLREHNSKRCSTRFSPYSTFKIPAAIMAFEKGIFKDEHETIKWDGVTRERVELNQDQTPLTFMRNSVKWVTEWIMPKVGEQELHTYLKRFSYGNEDFSGGLREAWVSSSLKISAHEQVNFLSKFWNNKLGLAERSTALTKKIIFIQEFGNDARVFGKTGTGCLVGKDCIKGPGKMIGWFVGVLETQDETYVFTANASDVKDQKMPAGPRIREATIEVLKQLGLINLHASQPHSK